MRNSLFILLILVGVSACSDRSNANFCLLELEILNQANQIEVVGTYYGLSKGASDLESALEETLRVDASTLNGCLSFSENYPNCFGCFILDTRLDYNIDGLKVGNKVKVKLEKVKLNKPIAESVRGQKNVEYLYLVQSIDPSI